MVFRLIIIFLCETYLDYLFYKILLSSKHFQIIPQQRSKTKVCSKLRSLSLLIISSS